MIGTNDSSVTIRGDLYVKGTTSTVNQQVVTIDDNIIVVNNSPYDLWDGGFAVKRYQTSNTSGSGAVVSDTPEATGLVGGITGNLFEINLGANASNINDYYKGWWVKITSGTGQDQVRKIKSYDGTTNIATIYSDQDAADNPELHPREGQDLVTPPDTSSAYALYPCQYVMNIWDESADQFAFVCTPTNPSDPSTGNISINHYTNLRVNKIIANTVESEFINGVITDTIFDVTLDDSGAMIKTPLSGLSQNYGLYLIFVKPKTDISRAYGIFMIGRRGQESGVDNVPGTIVRIISVKGRNGEHLDMDWPSNSYPNLYYRPSPGAQGNTTTYRVKVVSL